ncbi:MAG TPA: hypothetical protein DCF33_02230 [Saprospirales bacterium]|nr:hypothetical protein [Saprospirales bacterium]
MSKIAHFITRWTQWEYYPWWLANIPVYGFWLWFAARARHLFFFSNVNPGIPLGGAMGESKWDILIQLPEAILPKTLVVGKEEPLESVLFMLHRKGMTFPIIAKPDVGERGFLVKKIHNEPELREHLQQWPVRFILQEFLAQPLEASVLYHRFPGDDGYFGITSVCIKAFLQVEGDGESTIRMLMQKQARAAFQLTRFEKEYPGLLDQVPAPGESVLLEPIGNHSRGTKFINGNHLITPSMVQAFEKICRQIPDIHYSRFDLKTESWDALQRANFKVMELNGVLGEPAHIYDPSHGMSRAYRDLWQHWRLLFRLHIALKESGHSPTPHKESWQFIREYFRYKEALEKPVNR